MTNVRIYLHIYIKYKFNHVLIYMFLIDITNVLCFMIYRVKMMSKMLYPSLNQLSVKVL